MNLDDFITAAIVVGYLTPGMFTARYVFRQQYERWMDKEIVRQKDWHHRKGLSYNAETIHRSLRDRWHKSEADDAILASLVAALIWPLALVAFFITDKHRPSAQEQLLMDETAYDRLRELERQAGLRPLDEEDPA